jgi:hypothetical protein
MWEFQEVGFRKPAMRLQCERSILHCRDLQLAIDWLQNVSLAQRKILLDAWAPIVRLQSCSSELQQGDFYPQRKERKLESWSITEEAQTQVTLKRFYPWGIVIDVLLVVGGQMQPKKKAEIDHKQVVNCLIESSHETSEPGFSGE